MSSISAPGISTPSNQPSKLLWMTPLTAPGPASNYLDWAWAAEVHIRAAKLGHVLDSVDETKRPSTWTEDNTMVVLILIQVIDEANYHYICPLGMNAWSAWLARKAAHEDHTSGGRIYWLQKLIMTRMESGTDIVDHIRSMSHLYDRLSALVTADKPLTADEIFATCLLICLPGDWLPPVSHLFQKPSITSSEVTIALERESVRRSTREVKEPVVAAQASSSTRCLFCRRKGHDLNQCRTAAKILKQSQMKGDGDSRGGDNQNRKSMRSEQDRTDYHRLSSDKRNKAAVVVPLDSSNEESVHQPRTSSAQAYLSDEPSTASAVASKAS